MAAQDHLSPQQFAAWKDVAGGQTRKLPTGRVQARIDDADAPREFSDDYNALHHLRRNVH